MSRNCSTPETNSSPIWRSKRRRPAGARTRPARAPHHPSASYDAAPRKGARPPGTGAWPGAAVAGHRPPVRRGSRTGHRYEPARDRGTRGDGAGQRRRTRGRPGPRLRVHAGSHRQAEQRQGCAPSGHAVRRPSHGPIREQPRRGFASTDATARATVVLQLRPAAAGNLKRS